MDHAARVDPAPPPAHRLDLGGGVVLDRVVEQQQPMFDAGWFFPGLAPAELAAERPGLEASGALDRSGELVLAVQSYVVRTPGHTIVVDTCVGNHHPYPRVPRWDQLELDTYPAGLAAAGLSPADVDVVVSTHLHGDHVGWHTRREDGRWVPTFPSARYVFVEPELAHWRSVHDRTPSPVVAESVLPVLAAGLADVVRPDAELVPGVRLEPAPGHTPGHVVVRVDGADRSAVVTGDLLHSPLQLRHPDLAMLLDTDPGTAAASRRRVLHQAEQEQLLLCTGPFPLPSVGTLAPTDGGWTLLPVSSAR